MRFRDAQYKLQQEVNAEDRSPEQGLSPTAKVEYLPNAPKARRSIFLGQLLVKIGAVKQEHLEAALTQQKQTKKKIGTLLVENGWISEAALVQALQLYQFLRSQGDKIREKFAPLLSSRCLNEQELEAAIIDSQIMQRPVETILVEKYQIRKQDIGQALSTFYHCPFVESLDRLLITPDLVQRLNPTYLKNNLWLPLQENKDSVTVLIDDPHDFPRFQDIRRLFPGKEIRFSIALRQDIAQYVQTITNTNQQQVTLESIPAILRQLDSEGHDIPSEEDAPSVMINENDSAIVRLANQIISDGYRKGASDIHIEPAGEREETNVRFRVDGSFLEYLKVPPLYRRALASRLKIMARLDIAERRKPQDGKIHFRLSDREIEVRVATLPTVGTGNEDIVLRILDPTRQVTLEHLHMAELTLQRFINVLQKPHGMILCVGPTGSGKTTTLHSALRFLISPQRKIWTVEDPVEITQRGIRQVQVNARIGLDFAATLRAFLRADPDVIMVGEIRDRETAEVSLRAALTGHLLLSTLHTNSAVETISRLIDMGLDPFHFADALRGVLAQRLVRTLCVACKESYSPSKEEYDALAYEYGEQSFADLHIPYDDTFTLFRPRGCDECYNTGYKGRIGLHELFVTTEEVRNLIRQRASYPELLHIALTQGMTTLMQDGITKVLAGWTDLPQVRMATMR
jgi:type II secretory ATPase GspE/PulE/Tfp pilus assembly ATPase PilB-like protein